MAKLTKSESSVIIFETNVENAEKEVIQLSSRFKQENDALVYEIKHLKQVIQNKKNEEAIKKEKEASEATKVLTSKDKEIKKLDHKQKTLQQRIKTLKVNSGKLKVEKDKAEKALDKLEKKVKENHEKQLLWVQLPSKDSSPNFKCSDLPIAAMASQLSSFVQKF